MTVVSNRARFVHVSTLNDSCCSTVQIHPKFRIISSVLQTLLPVSPGDLKRSLAEPVLFLSEFIFHLLNSVSFTTSPAVRDRTPTFEWLLPFKLIVRNSLSLWQQFLQVSSLSTDSPLAVSLQLQLLLFIIATVQAHAILNHLCIRSMNFLCNYI